MLLLLIPVLASEVALKTWTIRSDLMLFEHSPFLTLQRLGPFSMIGPVCCLLQHVGRVEREEKTKSLAFRRQFAVLEVLCTKIVIEHFIGH